MNNHIHLKRSKFTKRKKIEIIARLKVFIKYNIDKIKRKSGTNMKVKSLVEIKTKTLNLQHLWKVTDNEK